MKLLLSMLRLSETLHSMRPAVRTIFPAALLVFQSSLLTLTGCDSNSNETKHAEHTQESPSATPTPLFEVQNSIDQFAFAHAVSETLQQSLEKKDVILEIVLSTAAHELLPFGSLEPEAVKKQRWLYLIRESYGYHRMEKHEVIEELETLLNSVKGESRRTNDVATRITAALAQLALLERENEK